MPNATVEPGNTDVKPTGSANQVTEVNFGDVTEQLPQFKEPSTYAQWLGSKMAVWMLVAMCATSLLVWLAWWVERPTLDQVKTLLGATAAPKDVLDTHRAMLTEHLTTYRTVFELLVTSMLLPIFTLAAGYAFGSKNKEG